MSHHNTIRPNSVRHSRRGSVRFGALQDFLAGRVTRRLASKIPRCLVALLGLVTLVLSACKKVSESSPQLSHQEFVSTLVAHGTQAAKKVNIGIITLTAGKNTLGDVDAKLSFLANTDGNGDGFIDDYGQLDTELGYGGDFMWIDVVQSGKLNGNDLSTDPVVGRYPGIYPPRSSSGNENSPYYYPCGYWENLQGSVEVHFEGQESRVYLDHHWTPPAGATAEFIYRTFLVYGTNPITGHACYGSSCCVLAAVDWKWSTDGTTSSVQFQNWFDGGQWTANQLNWAITTGTSAPTGDLAYPGFTGFSAHARAYCTFQIPQSTTQRWGSNREFTGGTAFAFAGAAIAGAGDQDLDGYGDIILGTPCDNGSSGANYHSGTVEVHNGSTGATLYSLHGAGPIDAFGTAVATVGDIDGDSIPEILIGAPQIDLDGVAVGPGYVEVHRGSTGQLLYARTGDAIGDLFGFSAAGVGDLDGDGVPDFVVGAPDAKVGGVPCGIVRAFSGASGNQLFTASGVNAGDQFGFSVCVAEDYNLDGVNELLVGAPQLDTASPMPGYVRVVSGQNGVGLVTVPGLSAGEGFGASVGRQRFGGGVPPIPLVGAPFCSVASKPKVGCVYTFNGAGVYPLLTGVNQGDCFGASIAWIGDADGDGIDDAAVGAPQVDDEDIAVGSGYVKVCSLALGTTLAEYHGTCVGDAFGLAVAGLGDVNGDGVADVGVGAPLSDVGGINAGQTTVYSSTCVTDTDGDGVPDCYDGCPSDPLKLVPGACGCGALETDTDGDGVPDCIDNCASIGNPGQEDCDGDGIGDVCELASGSQVDVNGNGIPDECESAGATSYCTAKTNSLGCVPSITWAGLSSANAASGFVIGATNVVNNKSGLLFYGLSGPLGVPFQGGVLCVKLPIKRTHIQLSGGNPPPNDCSGGYAIDFNSYIASGIDPHLGPGVSVNAQYWARDPGFAAPNNTSLSNGIQFVIAP